MRSSQSSSHSRSSGSRWLYVVVVLSVLLSACAEDERRDLRLTPTSTVETGVRIFADNCPGPATVTLAVREDVLWEIASPPSVESEQAPGEEDESGGVGESVATPGPPGIAEFLIGQAPEGWTTTTPLDLPLEPGIRYTVRTTPDGQTIDFSTPDLAGGLLWDGVGNSRFNPNLVNAECSEAADLGGFAQSLALLGLLGVTSAATVLVAIILLLFVITRRFSRIRSIENKARRNAGTPASQRSTAAQRRRAKSKS